MAIVAGELRLGRDCLAKIMHQGREANLSVTAQFRSLINYQHGMNAGIDSRMIVRPLRDAEQGIDFRQNTLQRATLTQRCEEGGGLRFTERIAFARVDRSRKISAMPTENAAQATRRTNDFTTPPSPSSQMTSSALIDKMSHSGGSRFM